MSVWPDLEVVAETDVDMIVETRMVKMKEEMKSKAVKTVE